MTIDRRNFPGTLAMLAMALLAACVNSSSTKTDTVTADSLAAESSIAAKSPPNFILIFTDDQRWDAIGYKNPMVVTPNMNELAASGIRFDQAIVTTAVCSPSRATLLTGRYASANGVLNVDESFLNEDEICVSERLRDAGYETSYFGKWHLKRPATPEQCGFDRALYFEGIESYFDTNLIQNGEPVSTSGYLEMNMAGEISDYLREQARSDHGGKPFFIHYSPLAPHMDRNFAWPNTEETRRTYESLDPPIPNTWDSNLEGKPGYLATSRSRRRAIEVYGYEDPEAVRQHFRDYYGAVTDLDKAVGQILDTLEQTGLDRNTYVIFMGDNGWLMGEYKMTSKLLAYEASIRVPLIIAGPQIDDGQISGALVTNADITPTLLDLAGLPVPVVIHGSSLKPLMKDGVREWRSSVLYEAPSSQHEVNPIRSLRTHDWKYIQTHELGNLGKVIFEELYDLSQDPDETTNLAEEQALRDIKVLLRRELDNEVIRTSE
ncbi:sulfatase-like hydrolase/transferase [uncultured Algimonas sp.]|uniref:sulfatase-like hydrolase/transferase n=1 Tax=uncultured Algimonas sp. TaxID=1547920 RepID=UPI002635BBAC|nr:sulfatase-like hydrolase/transferase [uncultured Algimonas sp.]